MAACERPLFTGICANFINFCASIYQKWHKIAKYLEVNLNILGPS